MDRDPVFPSGRFLTTSLRLIRRVAEGGPGEVPDAWGEFCRRYHRPLLVFALLEKRVARPDAEDWVNSFFCYLMEETRLHRFDPGLGRFRSYLLTMFTRFGNDERKRARALKRGGKAGHVGDVEECADRYRSSGVRPSDAYEREWALGAIREAVASCERSLAESGDETARLWFRMRYADPMEQGTVRPSREETAKRLDVSSGRAQAFDERVKSRFRRHLEEQVRNDISSPEAKPGQTRILVREGLQELLKALAR
ncbi:MAG: sigma-70 family RNA polymerase sigma factor [Planctomycetes bacterium]|nr:sigma-70 family RNA polymerase sigma factor [Planctomycetota bacterium]